MERSGFIRDEVNFFLVAVKVPFYGFRMRKNIESYLVIEEQIRMEQFGIVECLGQICVSPKGRLQNISGYLSQCSASHAAQQCSLMVRHSHLCFSLSPLPLGLLEWGTTQGGDTLDLQVILSLMLLRIPLAFSAARACC